jgi:Glycosyltransferase family 9 (heptosyltransferase)
VTVADPSVPAAPVLFFEQAVAALERREAGMALGLFQEAERQGSDPDACGGGRWFCHMLLGNFESAWRESDQISRRGAPDTNRLWSGRSLQNCKVIVRCLHGLGDAIQFIRFAGNLRSIAEQVIVEVPGCLLRLFETMPVIDRVITWDAPEKEELPWDEHVEVMELPRIFRASTDNLPIEVPYLYPPQFEKLTGRRLPRRTNRMRVGLAWASSTWNQTRSVPPMLLAPLLRNPQLDIYGLNVGANAQSIQTLDESRLVTQLLTDDDDVLTTAALINEMDLVIAVDTMVAHLAGALGKPVLLLLNFPGDWRWMLERPDSPWYPTMRIFRQGSDQRWEPVLNAVEAALDKLPCNVQVPETIADLPRITFGR